jgi:hypothetical protein
MSEYAKIDKIIHDWGANNNVEWIHSYHDSEVRTYFVESSDTKKNIQVWIEALPNNFFNIKISDNYRIQRKRRDFIIKTEIKNIHENLDDSLKIATSLS